MAVIRKSVLDKFRRCKRWIGRLINYQYSITRDDYQLSIPVIYDFGRAHLDVHECHITAIFEKLQKIGALNLLVDIGANIGQTFVKHTLLTRGEALYIGFEPNPSASFYLQEIININNVKRAIVIPVALASDSGIKKIFLGQSNRPDPGGSINEAIRDQTYYSAHGYVSVLSGDRILEDLALDERNFTIKIDTEGSELEVLNGIHEILRSKRPFVIVEILAPCPDFSESVNNYRLKRREDIFQLMHQLNYQVYAISEDGRLLKMGSSRPYLKKYSNDYLMVPKEQIDRLNP